MKKKIEGRLFAVVYFTLPWIMATALAVGFLGILGAGPLAQAATQSSGFKEEVDRGGQVITTTTDAQFLTVPANARHAWIYVKGPNPACWGFNPAAAPTSTSGGEWPAGFVEKMDNDSLALKNVRLISCSEGATVVKVLYTGDRRIGD